MFMKTFPNRRVHCCLSSGTENSSGSLDVMGETWWVVRDAGRLAPGVEEGGEGNVLWVIHRNQSTHPQSSVNERREDRWNTQRNEEHRGRCGHLDNCGRCDE